MGLETHSIYMPHHALPLYIKITDPRFNDYKLWETYDIRYDDIDEDEFIDAHKAMLISKTECRWGEVPPLLMAFAGCSRDAEEATMQAFPVGSIPDDDRDMVILIFLRLDKTKEFVMGDTEPIGSKFTKEDVHP